MVKSEGWYKFRQVFPCPECEALRSRRYDLMVHLVKRHGKMVEEAKVVADRVAMKYEEITFKLLDVAPGSRYAKSVLRGE